MDSQSVPPGPAMTRSRPTWHRPRQALLLVLTGQTFRPAGPVAVVVGSIISAVNEGSDIVGGIVTAATIFRILVNFAVPYVVASLGYLIACKVSPPDSVDK